jgi:hypothetical protein
MPKYHPPITLEWVRDSRMAILQVFFFGASF